MGVFGCWGQEDIVEKSFHFLKDHQDRDSSCHKVADWRAYSILRQHDILAQYNRDEVSPSAMLPVSTNSVVAENLFRVREVLSPDLLSGISKEKDTTGPKLLS